MTKIDIFSCSNTVPFPIFGWIAIAVAVWFCWRNMSGNKSDIKGNNDNAPKFDRKKLIPLEYAEESIRLSEKRMAELIAIIQTLEKKALAIIAGAVALTGYISTKSWCGDITSIIAVISISSSILAIIYAGFIIKAADVGIAGSTPKYTVNYYNNRLREQRAKYKKGTPLKQIKEVEISYLLLTILDDYENAIELTSQVSDSKAADFNRATNCLLVAFSSALVWLAIKIGLIITNHVCQYMAACH